MSVYDCVTYFDENLILDLRFNILDKYVDKFIIVESNIDHAGNEKKLNFNIENFSKFKNKIYYYIVEDMPVKVNQFKKNWSPNFIRENYQRNAIQRCLINCKDSDLILISDADEIPNLDSLNDTKISKFALFSQINFLYKLNLVSNWNWLGTGISYFKYLQSPQWLRNKRFLRRGFLRRLFMKTQIISNGGWHFGYLKSPEMIFKKINSFAHNEHSNIKLEEIITRIQNKEHIINPAGNENLKRIDINQTFFPEYIVDNQNNLKEWIV